MLTLDLPLINPYMTTALIDSIHAQEGQALAVGSKLIDLTVDLGHLAHDCPPITHYQLLSREKAWVRRVSVRQGEEPSVGARLVLLSTDQDEALDGQPARNARVTVACVIGQGSWI